MEENKENLEVTQGDLGSATKIKNERTTEEEEPTLEVSNSEDNSTDPNDDSSVIRENSLTDSSRKESSDIQFDTSQPIGGTSNLLESNEDTNITKAIESPPKKTKEEFIEENRDAANKLSNALEIHIEGEGSMIPRLTDSVDSVNMPVKIPSSIKPETENASSTARDISRNIESIKTVDDRDAFSILDWANLQMRFKDHYYLIRSEVASRDAIMKDIIRLNYDCNNTHLKIKESNDRMQKKHSKEEWKEEDITKVILDDTASDFGDAQTFIKRMLFLIFENPKIIATIVKHNPESYKFKMLDDTLCNNFYEDLLSDGKYDHELLRLFAELLTLEFERAEKFTDLYTTGGFTDKMLSSYVKRSECKRYAKTLLKNHIMIIMSEKEPILLDPAKINTYLSNKKERSNRSSHSNANSRNSVMTRSEIIKPHLETSKSQPASSQYNGARPRTSTIAAYAELFKDSSDLSTVVQSTESKSATLRHSEHPHTSAPVFMRADSEKFLPRTSSNTSTEEIKEPSRSKLTSDLQRPKKDKEKEKEPFVIPVFHGRSKKSKDRVPNSTNEIRESNEDTPKNGELPPMVYENNMYEHYPEVNNIFQNNLTKLRVILSGLIASIFDNLYNMPAGMRILCKIMLKFSKQYFPSLSKREYQNILGNFLFAKWIIPFFLSPDVHGIIDDFQKNTVITTNLIEVSKVLKRIFFQDYYTKDDYLCSMNSFIHQLLPSIEEYYAELCDVNDQVIEDILTGRNTSQDKNQITSRSITISIYEIQLLAENIAKYSKELSEVSKNVVRQAENILYYNQENSIFVEKTDPVTKQKLKTTQAYINFFELIMPKQLSGNYLEEFNRIQNYSKDSSEHDKVLAKAKHLLKQVLISIEDLRNLRKMSVTKDIDIEEVLEKYQEKLYANEVKMNTQKEKAPVFLSARYLLTCLRKLEWLYRENNYQKVYNEMVVDFREMIYNLNENIVESKLQLLKGVDTMTRNFIALKEVNEKKKKAIKRGVVREFIQTVSIPLCITSPSTRKQFSSAPPVTPNSKNMSKSMLQPVQHESLASTKLVILKQKDCIHERFAFMKELTSNLASLATLQDQHLVPSKLDSQLVKGKRGTTINPGDDYFNEKGSHCSTISEFIEVFGNIPEVQDVIREFTDPSGNTDKHGVNEAFTHYLDNIYDHVKKTFKNLTEDEYKLIMDEIECYITKRLYTKIYPTQQTYSDQAFLARVQTLEWIDFDFLEIPEKNRCPEMWEYAAKIFSQIDNKWTPLEKLDCMVECFKCVVQVSGLAATKESSAGADETLPILIYVLLKAAPKRMLSNLNFISAFRHSGKLLSEGGFCLTNFKSVTSFIENLDYRSLKMKQADFDKKIYEHEVKYQIYFMKNRQRSERQMINFKDFRNTIDLNAKRKQILGVVAENPA